MMRAFRPLRAVANGILRAGRTGIFYAALGIGLGFGSGANADSNDRAVQFVGCAADGQTGPAAALRSATTPTLPAPVADRLAYYASFDVGVLAPRGWHCFGLYGSNGGQLVVTPDVHDADDLLQRNTGLRGPAIHLVRMLGSTSGRFEVARVAARLFPVAMPFVQRVIDEGLEPRADFSFKPYPHDALIRRSDTEVEFVTPANSEGLGTMSRLAKDSQPISGVAILLPGEDEDWDLVMVSARMPPDMRDLEAMVIADVERTSAISSGK